MPSTDVTQPRPESSDVIIKGSWEDRLIRGQQLIASQNDEAIMVIQPLIDRLGQMPDAQLKAANQRLERILFQAITDLVFYLTYRDRYAEALANMDVAMRRSPPEQRRLWQQHSASIMLQSGALDDAFALLERIAREGEPEQWHDLVMNALRHNRLDVALRALDETERVINRKVATLDDKETAGFLRGQLAYLKAQTALAQLKLDESLAWAEHAMATSEFFRKNPSFFYVQIVEKGFHDKALTLIRRDRENPLRSNFWGGVAHHRLGRSADAERLWQEALRVELPEEGTVDLLELILAHYYLGDREGRGLAIVLDGLRQERDVSFAQHFLAGLGWAHRGDTRAAHSNLRLALVRSKSTASGRLLPSFWWEFCKDILPETQWPEYADYFDLHHSAA